MRTIGVISRNNRGTGSGTSAVCETSGEEDRVLEDSSRDSSDATDETVGSLPPGMHEGDQRKSLGGLARAVETSSCTGGSTGDSSWEVSSAVNETMGSLPLGTSRRGQGNSSGSLGETGKLTAAPRACLGKPPVQLMRLWSFRCLGRTGKTWIRCKASGMSKLAL